VMLCRACCCGTTSKHPRTDHDGQVFAMEDAARDQPGVEVRIVDCLDVCERSNVALVRRPALPRKERDTWLGGLLTDSATTALAGWLRDGATGELPPRVEALVFDNRPSKRKK
jgi:predicted metal-binding protein